MIIAPYPVSKSKIPKPYPESKIYMSYRTIPTDRQRASLSELPTDDASMLRHYALADDDLEIINARHRDHDRFGFALSLCAPRYPRRLVLPGKANPVAVSRFLAAQLGLGSDDPAGLQPARKPGMSTWRPCPNSTATRSSLVEGRAISRSG